ncbi:MAG: ASCH domain-containing protein [Pseudomonadota bacterium]
MMFAKRLREGVRTGRITCSVRIWQSPRVRPGGIYPMEGGHIVVESIDRIEIGDITGALARRSGFAGVIDLLKTAKHGSGTQVYLVTFHYVGPSAGADDA